MTSFPLVAFCCWVCVVLLAEVTLSIIYLLRYQYECRTISRLKRQEEMKATAETQASLSKAPMKVMKVLVDKARIPIDTD